MSLTIVVLTGGGERPRQHQGGQDHLCLLFIHPGAPNLISLRSAGTIPA